MSLKEQIQEDMKSAMKAKEQRRLGTIRLLLAAVKQREVDERITLDDTQVLSVIDKMLKQRRDSATQYSDAGRQDLADQERYEMTVLEEYLPEQLSDTAIDELIQKTLSEVSALSMKDMGAVMAVLRPALQGRADMAAVSVKVKQALESLTS